MLRWKNKRTWREKFSSDAILAGAKNPSKPWRYILGKSKNLISVHIYLTPAQKMMLDAIATKKRIKVSLLMRNVMDTYVKYMDTAFLHPPEQDIMLKLAQLEDRLVKLSLKGLHATGRIHYLSSMLWKFGASRTGLDGHEYEVLMEKSNIAALNWLENRSRR